MFLFYQPELTSESESISFNKDESRHIVKVLRKEVGDKLEVTNGKGDIFTAEIEIAQMKNCIAKIIAHHREPALPYQLHLAVAPTKSNERYEWFLEKATEIGITEITPIICEHSERRVVKIARFKKIIESAMKQSLSSYLPKLNEAVDLKQFLRGAKNKDQQLYIAHCLDSDRSSLMNAIDPAGNVTIVIGPEGDFSEQEIDLALENNFTAVSLGEKRLRTETAAVVCCTTVSLINS